MRDEWFTWFHNWRVNKLEFKFKLTNFSHDNECFYVAWMTTPVIVGDITGVLSPPATWGEIVRATKTNRWCTFQSIAGANAASNVVSFKMTIKIGKMLGNKDEYRTRGEVRGGDIDGTNAEVSPNEHAVGYLIMLVSDNNPAGADKRLALDASCNMYITMYGKELETD